MHGLRVDESLTGLRLESNMPSAELLAHRASALNRPRAWDDLQVLGEAGKDRDQL